MAVYSQRSQSVWQGEREEVNEACLIVQNMMITAFSLALE